MAPGLAKTVLIAEPQPPGLGITYLPWVWGRVKTYWEHHRQAGHEVNWLDPIYVPAPPETLLLPYKDIEIDLLLLACYSWNWRLQCRLAELVKMNSPRCLVVASGPEAGHDDPRNFNDHPYFDLIAMGDVEVACSDLLASLLGSDGPNTGTAPVAHRFAGIAGLCVPTPDRSGHVMTGAPVRAGVLHSPYLAQSRHYERFRATMPAMACAALWETRPNVPCAWERSWGGAFGCNDCHVEEFESSIEPFDPARLQAEADWLARLRAGFVTIIDDGFTRHQQDPATIEMVIEANARHGFPFMLTYRIPHGESPFGLDLARRLQQSRVAAPTTVPIHGLGSASFDASLRLAREVAANRLPLNISLTLGAPGDSPERLAATLTGLMERGLHSSYQIAAYRLSRAPRGQPDLHAVERYMLPSHGAWPRKRIDPDVMARSWLVTGTDTFGTEDWIRMKIYSDFVTALHCGCLTDSIAIYLRIRHEVSYRAFYDALIEDFSIASSRVAAWQGAMRDHYTSFLRQPESLDFMAVGDLPSLVFDLEPSRWLMFNICHDIDGVFDELERFLASRFPAVSRLSSLIDYQKNIIVLPRYDKERGKMFFCDVDWIDFFDEVHRHPDARPGEPEAIAGGLVGISDVTLHDGSIEFPLDWGNGGEEVRWVHWIHRIAVGRYVRSKNNHQKLKLHRPVFHQRSTTRKFDA